MKELLSYVFSPLREGDFALYRGSGNGLAPILLVAAEDASAGSLKQLQHEYACSVSFSLFIAATRQRPIRR